MSEARVAMAVDGNGVAHVRLARVNKMNALDAAMLDALIDTGDKLAAMPDLRCVVLSGEGKAFCAGLDLTMMGTLASADLDLAARTHGPANRFQQVAMQWRSLPVPVVAAIHGVCFGGGLQIAAGADIRIAAPDARLSVMELKWGIVPDMGHFALWRGLVRADALRELTYTAREFSGVAGRELGFVTHVDADPLARALALAAEIAAKDPAAIRAAKALFAAAADQPVDVILMAESEAQDRLLAARRG